MLSSFDGAHKQQIEFITTPQFRIKFQTFETQNFNQPAWDYNKICHQKGEWRLN